MKQTEATAGPSSLSVGHKAKQRHVSLSPL